MRCRRIRWKIAPMFADVVDALMTFNADGIDTVRIGRVCISTLSYA